MLGWGWGVEAFSIQRSEHEEFMTHLLKMPSDAVSHKTRGLRLPSQQHLMAVVLIPGAERHAEQTHQTPNRQHQHQD